jgi:hypothetical protein
LKEGWTGAESLGALSTASAQRVVRDGGEYAHDAAEDDTMSVRVLANFTLAADKNGWSARR